MISLTLPKIIICDIDGTLALLGNRDRYNPSTGEDLLNNPIANILKVYNNQNLFPIELIFVSGREDKYRDITEKWLQKHGITHYKLLLMRQTGDFRKDYIIKKELFEKHIKGKYEVLFVLDDRDQVVKMWRELGLTCLQVAYGNF